MKVLRITLLVLFIAVFTNPLHAQRRDLVAMADKTFEIGEYYNAIDKYKKAYKKEKDRLRKTEISYKLGHCYRLTKQVTRAKAQYYRVLKRNYPDPMVHFYYAEMLKMNGELKEAKEEYEAYLTEKPEDQLAQFAYQGCDSMLIWKENPTRYEIENIRDFNTRENDFAPYFGSGDYRELYITSSREGAEGNKLHGATGESFTDIFFTRLDNKQKWSVPVPMDRVISSMYDDGVPWVSSDGNRIYFTRCRFDKVEELGCQIMMSTKAGSAWSEPTAFPLAHDSVVIAHPSLSEDELTMLFVSNLYGGYGGKDIWKVSRESASGNWGVPDNMGEIVNSSGDEMFPYFKNDSLFYFSSNGHLGLGGLDIFESRLQPDGKWIVENMKVPLNSEADDFGIVFQKQDKQGYFTSSRDEGGRGGDDIYSFVLPVKRFSVSGVVLNENDQLPIDSVNVSLIGSEGTNLEYITDSTGIFSFNLKPETDYILVSLKRGFLNGKFRETTMGIPDSRNFEVSLVMAPIEKPVELPNILYDLAKWDLRPESLVALDDLVETLEDNPNITIELMSHTDVRPFSTMSNLELSQRRAQSVVDYLMSKDIEGDRLKARGYGPELPRSIDELMAEEYDFIVAGDTLSKEFIEALENNDNQEIAHQINRRTEFRVLSTDYVPRDKLNDGMDLDQQILEMGQKELNRGGRKQGTGIDAEVNKMRKAAAKEKIGKIETIKKLP
ncbi:MAG: OmpA family protein [Bacteroidetes bacterium]|nr:OmpA family protein [Bacteroidota bacterium]